MERKCRELDVPYKRNGALVLAFGNDGDLRKLRARGMTNGVDVEIISVARNERAYNAAPYYHAIVYFAAFISHTIIILYFEPPVNSELRAS